MCGRQVWSTSESHPVEMADQLRESFHPITARPISEYFHLTLKQAAIKFGVCITSFKRICREEGLKRWPHRKVCPSLPTYRTAMAFGRGHHVLGPTGRRRRACFHGTMPTLCALQYKSIQQKLQGLQKDLKACPIDSALRSKLSSKMSIMKRLLSELGSPKRHNSRSSIKKKNDASGGLALLLDVVDNEMSQDGCTHSDSDSCTASTMCSHQEHEEETPAAAAARITGKKAQQEHKLQQSRVKVCDNEWREQHLGVKRVSKGANVAWMQAQVESQAEAQQSSFCQPRPDLARRTSLANEACNVAHLLWEQAAFLDHLSMKPTYNDSLCTADLCDTEFDSALQYVAHDEPSYKVAELVNKQSEHEIAVQACRLSFLYYNPAAGATCPALACARQSSARQKSICSASTLCTLSNWRMALQLRCADHPVPCCVSHVILIRSSAVYSSLVCY